MVGTCACPVFQQLSQQSWHFVEQQQHNGKRNRSTFLIRRRNNSRLGFSISGRLGSIRLGSTLSLLWRWQCTAIVHTCRVLHLMALCASEATSVVKYYSFVSLESSKIFIVDELGCERFDHYLLHAYAYCFYITLYKIIIENYNFR